MSQKESPRGHAFGTSAVFLSSICTILGAVLYLRFGYAVAHVGVLGTLLIIAIGHMITIPTALAVSEIATNQRIEGGGEYFIISRSFGTTIGGSIGITLYLSQVFSLAFYLLAFGEAFGPVFHWVNLQGWLPFAINDPRFVSIPVCVALVLLMAFRGASVGVKALWGVAFLLAASLGMFFLGSRSPAEVQGSLDITNTVVQPDSFFKVFAVVFPAFTGMTAGVGLSGDLRNPERSIPIGVMNATIVGMIVYVAVVFKLATNATSMELATDQLIMSQIAVWGPIIPIGLGAAALSSALGSIMVAPRTLHALANDRVLPSKLFCQLLAKGRGDHNEPVNATFLSGAIVFVVVSMGSINLVAEFITLFFLVTYGALCGISFLEHFAANPSYRPSFRSRWYLSLAGSVLCFLIMLQLNFVHALVAIALQVGIYLALKASGRGQRDLSAIFQGVMFQTTRNLQILLQKRFASFRVKSWRPSFISIQSGTFDHPNAFDFLKWVSHRYGFSTLIHHIEGKLSPQTTQDARRILARMIELTQMSNASVFVDTVVSPSYETALAQMVQVAGVSGLENNSILFEFQEAHPEEIEQSVDSCKLVAGLGMNICVLRSSDRRFGFRKKIHIWLTQDDENNANLMIILAFIIMGHSDWESSEITIYASYPEDILIQERAKLTEQIQSGRLPIALRKVRMLRYTDEDTLDAQIVRSSAEADLTMIGFKLENLEKSGSDLFKSYPGVHDVLFVCSTREIKMI